MSEIVLNAEIRETAGKKAKRVRSQGKVPGVYYIHGEQNVSIQVPKVNLDPLVFTAETHVVDLRLPDGTSKKAILRDVQFDPVSDKPIHFDLQGLRENEMVTIEVPVALTGGIPKGVREGGMLQHVIHKLRVECLPKDIPEKIEINVAEMMINQSVHVRDLQVANATILENADSTVVAVIPPTVVKEAEVAAVTEEAIKEPEVVGKGKKAEEGAEAEAPAKEEKKK